MQHALASPPATLSHQNERPSAHHFHKTAASRPPPSATLSPPPSASPSPSPPAAYSTAAKGATTPSMTDTQQTASFDDVSGQLVKSETASTPQLPPAAESEPEKQVEPPLTAAAASSSDISALKPEAGRPPADESTIVPVKQEGSDVGGPVAVESIAPPEADDMELDDEQLDIPPYAKDESGKDKAAAPPSFSPSPSPSPSPPPDSHRPPPRIEAVKTEGSSSPLDPALKRSSQSSKLGLASLGEPAEGDDGVDDDQAMKRSSSHASASSSSANADCKVKKGALAMPPQLIGHLPRAEKEALATFVELTSNDYHDKKLSKTRGGFQDAMVCDCSFTPGVDDEALACSAYSGCINRATQVECVASDCNCGKYCQNQRFQRREYADVEIVQTEHKGFGLRAATDMMRETFIYEYVGEVMNEPTFRQRMQQYRIEGIRHFYFMMLQKGEYLDATKKGGRGRFINHSCNPNCFVAKWQVGKHMRMGIFAKRDIARGEELTFDYNVDRYGNDAQKCHCGEPNCVGTLGGKTQTDIGGIADIFLQALGIKDQVEQMEARGTKKRKSKELDRDFVPLLRPVKVEEVFKVMTGIRQANANQQILQKLLMRVEMTEDPDVQKSLVKLHGFDAMYGVLVDWKEDRNIIMLALSSLARWPLIAKNKVVDSGIETQVAYLRAYYRERSATVKSKKQEDGGDGDGTAAGDDAGDAEAKEDLSVSSRAEQLLDAWDKLDMGYRIARREADDAAAVDAAREKVGYSAYVDRRRTHELVDEQTVALEEARAPNAVSEELGKPMPDWSRNEMDMPMRQLPAAIGRGPAARIVDGRMGAGLGGHGGGGGPGFFSPARGTMNGVGFGGSPRTPDQMLPGSPSPFHKLNTSSSLKPPPAVVSTPSQTIEDIIRQANEEEEKRRKRAEAQARAAREAELSSSSSPQKHSRPSSTSASHSDKRRKSSSTTSTSRGVIAAGVGIDFNEDGSVATPTAGSGATYDDASTRASSNEKKLRKMIGEIVVKQMSKHKDEFERETFKKYAKELTNVIVSKEMKNPKYYPPPNNGVFEELSNDKRTKVKAFCIEYIGKLLGRKGNRVGSSSSRRTNVTANGNNDDERMPPPPTSNQHTPSIDTPR